MVTVRAPSKSATSPRKIAPYRPVRMPIDRNRSPKGAKASSPKPMLMGIVTTAATRPPVRSPRRLLFQLPGKTANAESPARGAGCSARGSSDRSFASTTFFCRIELWNPRVVHPDLVDAGARSDVQGLVVGVAELDVGDELGGEYRPQMSAPGRELVDHVRGDVAQQQVAALLDPDDAFGKPKAALHQLQLGVGGHQRIERWIQPGHRGLVALRLRDGRAGTHDHCEQGRCRNRNFLHKASVKPDPAESRRDPRSNLLARWTISKHHRGPAKFSHVP